MSILTEVNTPINNWGKQRFQELKQEIVKLGIRHTAASASPKAAINSLQYKTRKQNSIINRLGYVIPRHMIYVHKGVGRGTTIAQAGKTNRKIKPWFNPVIDRHMDELGDLVAEKLGDGIINNILIK